ncbi:MAG: DUF3352 domain-containing protein [Aeromicrobium sp.]
MTETTVLPAAPKPRPKGLIVAAIAVPIVLIGGGAFAWQLLGGGGTQPDEVLPANVAAYARLDADPSASQKIKLFKLIKKAPNVAKELGIKTDTQDLRKDITEEILGKDCKNVDYDKDIKPWLGDRIGIAATSDLSALVAIQVTDEKAARKGIALATGCQNLSDPGIVFAKGYALVAETQKAAAAAAKYAVNKPLSAKRAFTEDMQSLGDQGIASVWVDAGVLNKAGGDSMFGGGAADKSLQNVRSAAFTLRAGDNNVEFTGIGHTRDDIGKVATVNLGALPAKSLFVASVSGGAKQVDTQWSSLTQGFAQEEIDSTLKLIEDESGFKLPQDLKTLLGDNLTLVAGDSNLSILETFSGPQDLNKLDIAIAMHSDSAAATKLAKQIAAKVAQFTGIELAVVTTKDGAVLATNETFAKDFKSGKKLSDSESFKSVIDRDESAYGGFFLDIAKIVKAARGMELSASDKRDLAQLKELQSFGLSATKDGDRVIRGTLKLSFR